MKKIAIVSVSLLIISIASASDKNIGAIDFIKILISKSASENGYINALRFFQYTATTEKNNPSSYILSKWGKDALKESGLEVSDRGKYLPVLSDRSGIRIEKLWMANKEEIFKLFPASAYDDLLKTEIDTLIEFRGSSEYSSMMKKMKAKQKKPGIKTIDIAGEITQWSGFKQLAFWYRRDFEKNDKVVFEMLKEIKAHYTK